MNITEITNPAYYHGSRWKFPVGFILKPGGASSVGTDDPEMNKWDRLAEQILERFRPKNVLPRHKSVFLVDRPDADLIERAGGYAKYIFQVEPLGPIWKGNLYWYRQIWHDYASELLDIPRAQRDFSSASQIANNYWNCVPHAASDTIEYRCASAKVVRLIQQPTDEPRQGI